MRKQFEKDFGSTLFMVASPFQCVCMIEAIAHYKIKRYKVIAIYSEDIYSIEKIRKLLINRNIIFSELYLSHLLKDSFRLVKNRKRKRYDNVFIGDCFARLETYAYLYLNRGGQLYYLDDGNSTITRFTKPTYTYPCSLRLKFFLLFIQCYAKLKKIKRPIYFSIFNDSLGNFLVEHNDFGNLIQMDYLVQTNDIYIIGTNSSVLEFKGSSYYELLSSTNTYICKHYPNSKIFYCPHRRNADIDNVIKHCKTLGIEIFNTQCSVEVDLIEQGIVPKVIIGFNSTALYTLHLIYPKIDKLNMRFHLKDDRLDTAYMNVRQYYEEKGIKTIDLC